MNKMYRFIYQLPKKFIFVFIFLLLALIIGIAFYKNIFFRMSPDSSSFDIKHFEFKEYSRSEDIVLILSKYLEVGMGRDQVESIINQAGGVFNKLGDVRKRITIPGLGHGYNNEFIREKIDVDSLKYYVKYEMPMKMSAIGRAYPGGHGRALTAYYDADNNLRLLFVSNIPTIY